LSALGYWASACVGNTSYWVLIKSTLGAVIPAFGEGNSILAVAVSSVGLWAFHFMVLRGIKEATAINRIVTIAKVIPILVFIVLVAVFFKYDVFAANFWGGVGYEDASVWDQVQSTMLVTVFVFLGIEGASVYSRFAQKREHVGWATLIGFAGVLTLMVLVTMLSYGVLPRAELAALRQPSMGAVLEAAVGAWGAVFVGVGLIVSVLGAYLAWSLMAAEVLFVSAKADDMPKFLKHENAKLVPSNALLVSSLMVQFILIATLFSEDAFTFALKLTSSLSLIPFFLCAAYALKLAWTRETYAPDDRDYTKEFVIAVIATIYTAFLVYAGGLNFFLLSFLVYGPGTVLWIIARSEQGKRLFSTVEWVIFAISLFLAALALYGLIAGWITI
jgi:arginine:ornithine antiporter/lysine permease